MNLWTGIVVSLLLVLANGFFVATEFSVVKVRSTRLQELERAGSIRARSAQKLVARLDEYLSATQLGITLASLGLGWIGEPIFARFLQPLAASAGLGPAAVEAFSLSVSFTLITFLHIVFGELAPKSLAIQRAEETAMAVAAPMRAFYAVFYPVIWVLNGLAALTLRAVRLRPATEAQLAHSEEELRFILTSMRAAGGVPRERLDMLERTLRLPSKVAKDLMVQRSDIRSLRIEQTVEELQSLAEESGFSRFPVVDDDMDHVVGFLNLRDVLLRRGWTSQAELRRLVREPLYVPEAMPAEKLLREFRDRRQHMAIVVDEYGGTAGLVTAEDVVGAVVGEIPDEFTTGGPAIVVLASGRAAVDPSTPLEDLAQHFGASIDVKDVSTVGGLIMHRLGRVPVAGDSVQVEGIELRVEEVKGPRVSRLSASLPKVELRKENAARKGT
ncbi:MAG: hypothetical protein A2V77_04920 [Anaeromyxobacter sp. RBG_16_69_14]|nr:MAG: hypothetical protein A2V77_04920 [Anaeromyxobacter sp. RBG_16_69_14]